MPFIAVWHQETWGIVKYYLNVNDITSVKFDERPGYIEIFTKDFTLQGFCTQLQAHDLEEILSLRSKNFIYIEQWEDLEEDKPIEEKCHKQ